MDALDISTLTQLINGVGFPIAVAGWLLFKNTKDMKELHTAINNNTKIITVLAHKLGVKDGDEA